MSAYCLILQKNNYCFNWRHYEVMTELVDDIFISLDGKADWSIQSNKMGRIIDILYLMIDLRKYYSHKELPKGFVSFAKIS